VDELASLRQARGIRLLAVGLISALMLVVMAQALAAQESVAGPADLTGSSKGVSLESAEPGDQLHYSIVISNSGDELAAYVVMTDDLPSELTLLTPTVTIEGGGLSGISDGVITWTGGVNVGYPIVISFDATVTEGLSAGHLVTNTAAITGTGELLLRSAVTEIISETVGSTVYLPLVYRAPDPPTLNPIPYPGSSNQWTVSWSWDGEGVPDYELQESTRPDFASAVSYDMGSSTSKAFAYAPSFSNTYYYRVRVTVNGMPSNWSNTRSVTGNYYDGFNSSSSGWAIRRQDTDDVNNSSWYQDGNFVLNIGGRWDYGIAAPLAKAPALPYRIKTRVKWDDPDNLHSYGIIFGGDWDGRTCPNSDYSSCFNHYYRLNVVWHGSSESVSVQLKRIDYHGSDNSGGGVALWGYNEVSVPDPDGWNEWTVEVRASGEIRVYANGSLAFTKTDSTYISNPYFGVFASSNEYLGARPWFTWYRVDRVD
jgi:uncharacterized repeat protein (TIGR01451 family)